MLSLKPQLVRRATEVVRGLWLTPVLIATAGVGLGIAAPLVDAIPDIYTSLRVGWLRSVVDSSAEGARALLAAGAGALAAILGVAFSLTLVTLQLAAGQYTTRVIARFTDDRVTKIVLGTYVGSVAYLLLVLRAVHDRNGEEFVPRLSLALGIILILTCLALLAYFLNHLAGVIQASSIVTSIARRTIETLAEVEHEKAPGDAWNDPADAPARVLANAPGYVQIIDIARIAGALPHRTHVRLEVRAGDFLIPGTPIASLWPAGEVSADERRALRGSISVGHLRTEDQDVLLGVQRLSDIALRALSPSVNDETTAILALNELGVIALEIGRVDAQGGGSRRVCRREHTTVTVRRASFAQVMDEGFRGICRFSVDHPRVLARTAEILGTLSEQLRDPAIEAPLARGAAWIRFALDQSTATADDRVIVEDRLRFATTTRAAPRDEPAVPSVH